MSPFAATKLKAQSIEMVRPEFREELPKRGLLFLVGNQYSTGRRAVVDIDRSTMQFRQRAGYALTNVELPRRSGPQKLSEAQLEELIARANVFWASDPQFGEARRSKPDQGVTMFLVDGSQVKQFDSHDPADEIHRIYETLWRWAGAS